MTIGLIFPTCDIDSDPIAIRDWVEAAGELGVGARWNHRLFSLHGAPLAKLIARVDRGTRGWFRFR